MSGISGPFPITADDIGPVNQVFSDGFSERYRRDGMVGVRVPTLNHAIWRFSIADAGDGAMLWRDADGAIAAFNVAHRSGEEGWMGPIVVRPDLQAQGLGKTIVRAGIAWLKQSGAKVIGLETMPRTVDNIGFYSSLGFIAGPLTITFTLEAMQAPPVERIGRAGVQERDGLIAECALLTRRVSPAHEFTREMLLTAAFGLGDTVLVRENGALVGFAVCHAAPLVEGRAREELRILKVVLSDASHMPALARVMSAYAREASTQRAALRVQANYEDAYRAIVAAGARVRWTDLRMTLSGYSERTLQRGVVFSNWEI